MLQEILLTAALSASPIQNTPMPFPTVPSVGNIITNKDIRKQLAIEKVECGDCGLDVGHVVTWGNASWQYSGDNHGGNGFCVNIFTCVELVPCWYIFNGSIVVPPGSHYYGISGIEGRKPIDANELIVFPVKDFFVWGQCDYKASKMIMFFANMTDNDFLGAIEFVTQCYSCLPPFGRGV